MQDSLFLDYFEVIEFTHIFLLVCQAGSVKSSTLRIRTDPTSSTRLPKSFITRPCLLEPSRDSSRT